MSMLMERQGPMERKLPSNLSFSRAYRDDDAGVTIKARHDTPVHDLPRSWKQDHPSRAGDAHIAKPHANLALFWKTFVKLLRNGQKSQRRLFPSTRNQVRAGLGSFRNTFIPSLRQRAQSQIYQYLVARQSRKQLKKQIYTRNNLLAGLGRRSGSGRRTETRSRTNNVSGADTHNMAYFAQGTAEPGTRRRKLAGYLKAANEVRQSYVQSYFAAEGVGSNRIGPEDGPGAFPDAAVVRNGNEEMILFPSYARRHVKNKSRGTISPGREISEEELWKREWDKHQDVTAIVDVDVRGWIYTPHQGQTTRKQRLVIGLARQLSGVPAAPANKSANSTSSSRASSPSGSFRGSQQEEDLIDFKAEEILRKGFQEERYADRGAFSERPSQATDAETVYEGDSSERVHHRASYAQSVSSQDSDSGSMKPMQKRTPFQQPDRMTSDELAMANTHLLNRLKPFMANPLANTPISAFFYSAEVSRQLTVYTDTSGHFTVRAALDFVPTHVRVLAGEKLSATEEVIVTNPRGVSLISDIDDTVKHSAISAGPREIFRNAFIRELGDLTIDGVREWYNTLHDMGVKLHYVSNAPWQMYPVLTSYFKLANLPKGSFHLKQYSGVLQGIFEPVAERKKSSLDKLMRDFPERKFVLVGDSGEADLEVYTDTALENPGRVLGIFIRDVTTTVKTGYFDSNNSSGGGSKSHSREQSRHRNGDALAMSKRLSRPNDIRNDDADMEAAMAASLADMEQDTRRARRSINPDAPTPEDRRKSRADLPEEDLIDFSDDPQPAKTDKSSSKTSTARENLNSSQSSVPSPPPPPKPAGLRSPPPGGAHKVPPPIPRKSSTVIDPSLRPPSQGQTHNPSPLSQVIRQESTRKPAPPLPARPPRTYMEMAKDTIAKAPALAHPRSRAAASIRSQPSSPLSRPTAGSRSVEDLNLQDASFGRPAPPPLPPPRRTMTSTSSRQSTQRYPGGGWDESEMAAISPGDGVSKKEFLWKQRWERARNLLERKGVTIRSWRTGSDVADVCVRLVEMELRKIEKESRSQG